MSTYLYAPVVGDGTKEWDNVSINDLVELYVIVLARVIEGEDVQSGKEGVIFTAADRNSWKYLFQWTADAGVQLRNF
ncbi:hypothetical protein CC78DRAFT_581872 [Lojkania enalia]|uniref:Uncharacterized protein n=1 Tax=Lojkania enalia TaxID=147567 RepID=A0A9P4K8P6_9PLEO|nr:hypothetical protein CC78DRAFT_581872 [Didymosphaeria enalia]